MYIYIGLLNRRTTIGGNACIIVGKMCLRNNFKPALYYNQVVRLMVLRIVTMELVAIFIEKRLLDKHSLNCHASLCRKHNFEAAKYFRGQLSLYLWVQETTRRKTINNCLNT